MKHDNEVKAEINSLQKEYARWLSLAKDEERQSIRDLQRENALIVRGKILALQWVLRHSGRSKVYK